MVRLPPGIALLKETMAHIAYGGLPLSYTLAVTNTRGLTLHVTISDDLPSQMSPTGTLTWTAVLSPDGYWTATVVVTPEVAYEGSITNVLRAVSSEGAVAIRRHVMPVVSLASQVAVTKDAALEPQGGFPERVVYRLSVTNSSQISLTGAVLTDALPTEGEFAWASPGYVLVGDVVSWSLGMVAAGTVHTATVAISVGHLAGGTVVTNAQYGIGAAELSGTVSGAACVVTLPRRLLLLPMLLRDT